MMLLDNKVSAQLYFELNIFIITCVYKLVFQRYKNVWFSFHSSLLSLLYNPLQNEVITNIFGLLPLTCQIHCSSIHAFIKICPISYSWSSRSLQILGLRWICPVCKEWVDRRSRVSLQTGVWEPEPPGPPEPGPLCSWRGMWGPGKWSPVQVGWAH